MTKQPASFSPTELCGQVDGVGRNSWSRLGDGPWYGSALISGLEWEIEELSTSWRATSAAAQVVTAPKLELLLKKLVGKG